MAGRRSALVFGRITTGAQDDIAKATDIARSMTVQYGMDDGLGPMAYEKRQQSFLDQLQGGTRDYAEDTAREIDRAVRQRLDDAFDRATRILEINREVLEAAAKTLLERETLEGDALDRALADARLPDVFDGGTSLSPRGQAAE